MKSKNLLVVVILFAIFACSKNDNATPTPVTPPLVVDPADLIVTNFMPLSVANRWTYDTANTVVTPTPTVTQPTIGIDELFVLNDSLSNNLVYKKMNTNPLTPTGFYSTMLKGNSLRIDGSSLKLSGKIKYNVGTSVLNLAISDFTLFKENGVSGTIVGDTGSITSNQIIQGIAVTVVYKLTSKAEGSVPNMTYNNKNYTDVKRNIITINLAVSATFSGIPKPVSLLDSQDAIVSTQYYSKNNGMIKASTTIKYAINAAAASLFPGNFPLVGEQTNLENLKLTNF
ncbi:MAG: hypothetical protein H7174_09410 [Flavobacterium sp.]|nr:hypothetical protein [Flavobacterium sp.]